MKLWRICNAAYNTLEGIGGLYVAGRWHSVGRPIVYTADHAALASLEVLVHMDMDIEDLPDYVLLEIEASDDISIITETIDPTNAVECRKFGDKWLAEKPSALLRVSSVIIPSAYNFLINPLHPDIEKIKIVKEEPFEFDNRLFSLGD